MATKIKLLHAANGTSTPPALDEGELALNALADPPQLWTGVPTSRDPSGRIDLLDGTDPTTLFAPLVNPAGGQNNYLPINNPTFTGTLTGPTANLSGNGNLLYLNAPSVGYALNAQDSALRIGAPATGRWVWINSNGDAGIPGYFTASGWIQAGANIRCISDLRIDGTTTGGAYTLYTVDTHRWQTFLWPSGDFSLRVNHGVQWPLLLNVTTTGGVNFNRCDTSGAIIDTPLSISEATGDVSIANKLLLAADATQPLEAVPLQQLQASHDGGTF